MEGRLPDLSEAQTRQMLCSRFRLQGKDPRRLDHMMQQNLQCQKHHGKEGSHVEFVESPRRVTWSKAMQFTTDELHTFRKTTLCMVLGPERN